MKFVRYALLTIAALACLAIAPEPAEAGPLRRIGRAAGRVASAPFRVVRRARCGRCG
jgi:hypothetical protein